MCSNMPAKSTYSPQEFGQLIGRATKTLQKWDREGILKAHRSPTNRRYYTHDQYLADRGLVAKEAGVTIVFANDWLANLLICHLQNSVRVILCYWLQQALWQGSPGPDVALPHIKSASATVSHATPCKELSSSPTCPGLPFLPLLKPQNAVPVGKTEADIR